MTKPAVLLIGDITHAKKEWEECASFATLKVRLLYEHLLEVQMRIFEFLRDFKMPHS